MLPLCSALTGNHVQVSIGRSSYTHGEKLEQPHYDPAPAYPKPVDTIYRNQLPVYQTPALVHHISPKVYLTEAPSYSTAAPVYNNPSPVYHSAIKYLTTPQYNATPKYQTDQKYHTTPQYHTAPQYHTQNQNCSVVDEVVNATVCTPKLKTKCASVDVKVKVIVDKEQCQDITRTVCSFADEVIENAICVYSYEKQSEDTVAKTVKVTYAKECTSQRVTVCQPRQGYSYQSYGQQYCKEEDQETCYRVPKVTDVDTKVSVVFPSPLKSCSNKSITIQRLSCEDLIENKCITVPEVKEETKEVEKCEVSLAEPSCQEISLTLPKQVCVGLVYGHAVELTAQQYHAKVL
jgi:hypothetical protein